MKDYREYIDEAERILKPEEKIINFFWKAKEGENRVRILPRPNTVKFWWTMGWHYGLGKDSAQSFICPLLTLDQPCPICKRSAELYASEDEEDQQVAKNLYAKTKYVMNVIDRSDNQVKLLAAGRNLFSWILRQYKPSGLSPTQLSLLKLSSVACDFTDLKTGRDMLIIKVNVGKTPVEVEYSVTLVPEVTPVSEEIMQKLIDPLKVLPIFTYEDLTRALRGESITIQTAKTINEISILIKQEGDTEKPPVADVDAMSTVNTKISKIAEQQTSTMPEQVEKSIRLPKCFGKEYEPHDRQCQECEYKVDCEVNFSSTKAVQEPSKSPEDVIREKLKMRKGFKNGI